MQIELSKDQKGAIRDLLAWHKKKPTQSITLGGYAGTGKTTLIAILRKKLYRDSQKSGKKLRVAFCSYTGKAARVLRGKLKQERTLYPGDTVSTIHSLIYSPIENDRSEIVGWERKEKVDCDLIVVDEASMVDEEIWRDLLWFNVPIIAVGDHGQLPPIRGNFSLMKKPKLRLEEIHRQAKENPIIRLSMIARESGEIPVGEYAKNVRKLKKDGPVSGEEIDELLGSYDEKTLILCGYNFSRVRLNNHIRGKLGILEEIETQIEEDRDALVAVPQIGDRVICLRNNQEKQIFNGMHGTLQKITKKNDDWYQAEIEMDGEDALFKGPISVKQFNAKTPMNFTDKRRSIMAGDLFDFGYAITVHKAQGSEVKRVILFEERFKQMDDEMWARWLYTAVTRAQEELHIIGM